MMGKTSITSLLTLLLAFSFACVDTSGGGGGGGGGGGTGIIATGGSTPGDVGTTVVGLADNSLSSVCQTLGDGFFFGSVGGKLLTSDTSDNVTVLDGTARQIRSTFCDRQSTVQDHVWFVGDAGIVWKWDGVALLEQVSSVSEDLNDVYGLDTSRVYAVGDTGTIVAWNGSAWGAHSSPSPDHLYGIGAPNQNNIFAVGANFTVLKLTLPQTWTEIDMSPLLGTIPADTRLNGVWGDSVSGHVFVVGNAGTIISSSNGGTAWQEHTSGTSLELFAVHGSSNTRVFAVGEEGVVLYYDGSSWEKEEIPAADGVTVTLLDVWDTGSDVYATGIVTSGTESSGVLIKRTSGTWASLF